MFNITFNLLLCLVYGSKYVEDWFGYGKLSFRHLNASRLSFNVEY